MATVKFKGKPVTTSGELPDTGVSAPTFTLVKSDLSEISLSDYKGRNIVLNIFPSIDTPTCQMSVRTFNEKASGLENTVVLCISADLPFAQSRFCTAEGIEDVQNLSTFRSPGFGQSYGLTFTSGPFAGLLARAVIVVDTESRVRYTELVSEVADEPNYDLALAAV